MTITTNILTDEQERAVAAIDTFIADRRRTTFALQGLAGTGKTTVLGHIAEQYSYAAVCTLTGKAASVIRRRTDIPACTLHSFFYKLRDAQKDKRGRTVLTFERAHEAGALGSDLVLLDESSMISEDLAHDMLRAGARIIATGDPGQLPPVSGRQFFNHADFTLTEIHRQALESPIIRQAHSVRSAGIYKADGDAFRIARDGNDDDLRRADVILCWTNRTRQYMNQRCRNVRGYWQPHPQPGEPLICLKNAAPYGVFNGGIYRLLQPFLARDRAITLDVDGEETTIPNVTFAGVTSALPDGLDATTSFDFGYALTVHKSQGSEWDHVILIDEYRKTEYRREWLYTGITRAAESILVIR